MDRACKTCEWWEDMDDGEGICRFDAPTTYRDGAPWPLTHSDDWCRRWDRATGRRHKDDAPAIEVGESGYPVVGPGTTVEIDAGGPRDTPDVDEG